MHMKMSKILNLIAAVAVLPSMVAADANLVGNGDFEKVSKNGWAEGWLRRGSQDIWKLAHGSGTEGSAALVWECRDANAGRSYVARQISLRPGSIYVVEADILIDGTLKGPYGKGAAVHFEQLDANGKWLGGTYTEEIKTTGGKWRRMSAVSGPIKVKTAKVIARLQVTKGCTGKVLFDNFSVTEYRIGSVAAPADVPYRYAADRANTNRSVWIDGKHRARVKGKPFFPLGALLLF